MMSLFNGIVNWFWRCIYGLTEGIAWLVQIMYNCFEVASGLDTVSYDGKDTTLLNVVFGHGLINKAYWSMAIIGVGLCFFFTILAVIRKMFDSSNKVRSSLGEILTQCLKSILLICSMSLLMNLTLYFSTSLMEAVQLAFFSQGETATEENPKTFSEEEYAAMARVLNTIGNYSLNPSRNSRYNINSCYNDIRGELKILEEKGTFNVQYETPDILNNKEHYWQETLQKIVNAAPDLEKDVPLDVYNTGLSYAIEDAMDEILLDESFKPLKKYSQKTKATGDSSRIELDRMILVIGTFDAAKNQKYNGSAASLTDELRAPYYYNEGNHDVYSASQMQKDFDLSEYSYFMTIFLCVVLAKNMVIIILNCFARIFNMALLYLMSPMFIATSPLDDGGKFKQWGIAFIGQCFGVFGTVLAMDLLVMFCPIIMSSRLKISSNSFVDCVVKVIILWAVFETSKKASGMVTAILGDNGAAAAAAGDMTREGKMLGGAFAGAMGAIGSRFGKKKKEQEKGKEEKEKEKGSKLVEVPPEKAAGGGQDTGGDNGTQNAAGGNVAGQNGGGNAPSKVAGGGQDAGGDNGGQDAAGGNGAGQDGGGNAPSKAAAGDQDAGAGNEAGGENADSQNADDQAQEAGSEPSKVQEGEKDAGADQPAGDPSKVKEGEKDAGADQPAGGGENDGKAAGADSHSGGDAKQQPEKEKTGKKDSGSSRRGRALKRTAALRRGRGARRSGARKTVAQSSPNIKAVKLNTGKKDRGAFSGEGGAASASSGEGGASGGNSGSGGSSSAQQPDRSKNRAAGVEGAASVSSGRGGSSRSGAGSESGQNSSASIESIGRNLEKQLDHLMEKEKPSQASERSSVRQRAQNHGRRASVPPPKRSGGREGGQRINKVTRPRE